MGVGGFLGGKEKKKAAVLEVIRMQERLFKEGSAKRPEMDPHEHLIALWVSRQVKHGRNIHDRELWMRAQKTTVLWACLPPPLCATALGYQMLFEETPTVFSKYPEMLKEWEGMTGPLVDANRQGILQELYKKYNPHAWKRDGFAEWFEAAVTALEAGKIGYLPRHT
jgi:hypothetical protein